MQQTSSAGSPLEGVTIKLVEASIVFAKMLDPLIKLE
jgi:hypothetical protein